MAVGREEFAKLAVILGIRPHCRHQQTERFGSGLRFLAKPERIRRELKAQRERRDITRIRHNTFEHGQLGGSFFSSLNLDRQGRTWGWRGCLTEPLQSRNVRDLFLLDPLDRKSLRSGQPPAISSATMMRSQSRCLFGQCCSFTGSCRDVVRYARQPICYGR